MADAAYSNPTLVTKAAKRGWPIQKAIQGILTLTRLQVRWAPDDPNAAQPTVLDVTAITGQQRPKTGEPLLRLNTISSPVYFVFASAEDRDTVLDILAGLLSPASISGRTASTGAAANSTQQAQLKKQLLERDKDLRDMHKRLVQGGVLTEAEFWQGRQQLLRPEAIKSTAQRAGLPSAMIGDVRPSADGKTETLSFSLTPEVIRQIFAEKPEVHRAFIANVPHNVDEKTFWTKYFQRQMALQRKRKQAVNAANRPSTGKASKAAASSANDYDETDDMFAPFVAATESDKQATKSRLARVDPTVDVAANSFDQYASTSGREEVVLAQGAGLADMARDLNRHAAVVLQGLPDAAKAGDTTSAAAALHAQQNGAGPNFAADASRQVDSKIPDGSLAEYQRRAGSALDDLQAPASQQYAPLNVQNPRVFSDRGADADGDVDMDDGSSAMLDALNGINPASLCNPPIDPALAAQVMVKLATNMDDDADQQNGMGAVAMPPGGPAKHVLPQMQAVWRGCALAVNELLRHFWPCFPLSSPARRAKAERLRKALSEQYDTIQAMQSAGTGLERVYATQVLRPIMQAIDAAFTRYDEEATSSAMQQ